MYLLDMLSNVETRERESKRKKKVETIKQRRATDSKLEKAGRESKFKEASHLPISPVRDQLRYFSGL